MSAEVIVVGSVNVDLIVQVARLPAPGETVTGGRLTRAFGGKGANAATAAARLGARTALIAAIGADPDGRDVRADLEASGIDHRHVTDAPAATGLAAITVDRAGENTIAVASGANALLDADHVVSALEQVAGPASVVLANLEIADAAVESAARFCATHGLAFVLDPAPARPVGEETLKRCSALIPNRGELAALRRTPDELLAAGVRSVVVTLGAQGAQLHTRRKRPVSLQPYDVASVDSTGAGDAFAAGLVVAMQRGMSIEEAARYATAVGALATRAVGARSALPSEREVGDLV